MTIEYLRKNNTNNCNDKDGYTKKKINNLDVNIDNDSDKK